MILGAFVAALFAELSPLEAVKQTADDLLPGSGFWLLIAALPGLVTVITVNIYASSIELITILDSFKAVRPTRMLRIVSCTVIAAAGLLGAVLSSGEFLKNFGSFLVVLLYLLVPWTSVNLVDYYFVRRGNYAIREIFVPHGSVYGTWGWRGLAAYVVGIVAMIPFVVTVWYTGPIAAAMGDVDIALFLGLFASAAAYIVMARSLDLAAEHQKAQADAREHGIEAVTFAGRVAPVET